LPTILGNQLQIFQLFLNLIDNALKFRTSTRIPTLNITCEVVEGLQNDLLAVNSSAPYWKLSFSDNGIGFDSQYARKIFHMFQRLHGNAEFAGNGMGLAICKRIMENHKGFITADGVLDQGAIFICYFPVNVQLPDNPKSV
jgi:light-regulated signal transduction histidine kinase (bacteriophytochrome)